MSDVRLCSLSSERATVEISTTAPDVLRLPRERRVHAAGFHIHPELALLATTVGTTASWVPLLPGGLGIVQAAIPAILHRLGAPFDDALAATLGYRAGRTLLPAIAGAIAIPVLRSHCTLPGLVPATAST